MNHTRFKSFWMAGYECADHVNKYGYRVDLLTASNHLAQLEKDYGLLQGIGIRTVREGIRWSVVEHKPYHYDWSAVMYMVHTARARDIEQIWDICHFASRMI